MKRIKQGEEFALGNSVFTYSINEKGGIVLSPMLNKKVRKTKEFTPPLLEEVKTYFKEKGYTEESAVHAFEYYDSGNWTDSKGDKVVNWKQKMFQNMMFEKDKRKDNNKFNGMVM